MFDNKPLIQQIKNRVNIVDIIGTKIKLEKRGANYFGICPFHNEKSSSFSVNESKQIFHCFGCGKSGDVFAFLMAYENVQFKEALDILGNITGIEIPKINLQHSETTIKELQKIDILFKVNEALKGIFANNLFLDIGKPAREYLNARKIKEGSWRNFNLGFASHSSDEYNKLIEMGFSDDDLQESQNFLNTKNTRFFGRVIFPIDDLKNRCVGFGGRILSNEKNIAKYLNSSESLIFKKREVFFGENKINRSVDKLIITEGYLDVISMVENGFINTVAPLGTAISDEHIKKAMKFAKAPILAFDGDNAGLNAMYNAIDKILTNLKEDGKSFNFAILPKGEDLDSMVHHDKGQLTNIINAPLMMVDMIKNNLKSLIELNSPESTIEMLNAIREKVNLIKPQLLQNIYLKTLKEKIFDNNKYKNKFTANIDNRNKKTQIKTDAKAHYDFLFGVVILYPEILSEVGEQFLNLDCYEDMKNDILREYSDPLFEKGDFLLEKLKLLMYDDVIGKIFEKNIHIKYLSKNEDTKTLIENWLNVYHKVVHKEDLAIENSMNNKLKKWKSLNQFKKKID